MFLLNQYLFPQNFSFFTKILFSPKKQTKKNFSTYKLLSQNFFFSSPTYFVHQWQFPTKSFFPAHWQWMRCTRSSVSRSHDVFVDMVLVNNQVCLFLVLSLAVFTTASCYLDITNILLLVPTLGRLAGVTVL